MELMEVTNSFDQSEFQYFSCACMYETFLVFNKANSDANFGYLISHFHIWLPIGYVSKVASFNGAYNLNIIRESII